MKIDIGFPNAVSVPNGAQAERVIQQRERIPENKELEVRRASNESRDDYMPEDTIADDMLDKSLEQANNALKVHNKYIERSVHEKTHTIMYVLRDAETNEVIREFPPKKIQDMLAKMWEIAGLIVDERR